MAGRLVAALAGFAPSTGAAAVPPSGSGDSVVELSELSDVDGESVAASGKAGFCAAPVGVFAPVRGRVVAADGRVRVGAGCRAAEAGVCGPALGGAVST
ncbi:hypothetical protein, partial [Sphingorhabdus sp.]|uniref:hypothetical protein n=1 Tax=Sphingorhabdus sp. TaxID=1902408 RepID=UPI003C762332